MKEAKMADPTDKTQSAARLRADMDAGEGRDKIAYPDLAAAPLGANEAAADIPVSPEKLRGAHESEWRTNGMAGVDSARPGTQPDPRIAPARSSNAGLAVVAVLALAALAVLITVYP
jgi:hypothetical protein